MTNNSEPRVDLSRPNIPREAARRAGVKRSTRGVASGATVAAAPYVYDPLRHIIERPTPEARALMRRAPKLRDTIVCYRHAEHNTRVIARWVEVRSWGGVLEDIAVAPEGGVVNVEGVLERMRLREKHARNMTARITAEESARRQLSIDRREARRDFGRHMRRVLETRGVRDDPGIEAWCRGTRGFVPLTDEERDAFREASQRASAHSRESIVTPGLDRGE